MFFVAAERVCCLLWCVVVGVLLVVLGPGPVHVSAQCAQRSAVVSPDPSTPYGDPSPQALVLWVSSDVYSGGGQAALDAACTAKQPTTSNTVGGFTHQNQARVALLSYSFKDAYDLVPEGVDIVNTKGECLAADRDDLFASQNLGGVDLSGLLLDETGARNPGTIFVYTGTNVNGMGAGGTDPNNYCDDWRSTVKSDTLNAKVAGEIPIDTSGSPGSWLVSLIDDPAATTCDHAYHVYCISAAAAPTSNPGASQDPQFVGLQGQNFQVHGIPDEYFNLLSHPFTQLNSHFTYLATGTCNYNDTLCWSHPGTYVDELGVMLPGVHIGVRAGTHAQGLTVHVNGKLMHVPRPQAHTRAHNTAASTATLGTAFVATFPIQLDNDTIASSYNSWLEPEPEEDMSASAVGSGSGSVPWWSWLSSASVRLSFHSHNHVVIHTPIATLEIYNAEHFFNFNLEFRAPRLLLAGAPVHRVLHAGSGSDSTATHRAKHGAKSHSHKQAQAHSPHPPFPMHGLIGQTWKNVRYPHGRLYAGVVDDYMLSDRTLFSTNFHFNEYLY